ncbi:unnamed protein product [Orchesella dallaii]|uniref:Uncharacterized protein n=1 Tax=Orchesella dallaii TaxID=48710 RepID=A0ABP1QEZ8_9HEXA
MKVENIFRKKLKVMPKTAYILTSTTITQYTNMTNYHRHHHHLLISPMLHHHHHKTAFAYTLHITCITTNIKHHQPSNLHHIYNHLASTTSKLSRHQQKPTHKQNLMGKFMIEKKPKE